MNHKLIINTKVKDAVIIQEIDRDDNGVVTSVIRTMTDTSEAQIVEALVSLGWTPPPPNFGKEELNTVTVIVRYYDVHQSMITNEIEVVFVDGNGRKSFPRDAIVHQEKSGEDTSFTLPLDVAIKHDLNYIPF